MELKFYSTNCSTTNPDSTPELVASEVNGMAFAYDAETGILSYKPTREWYANLIIYAILPAEKVSIVHHVSYWSTGEVLEVQLTEEQRLTITGFEVQMADNMGYWDYATISLEGQIIGSFIYPTDTIEQNALPVALVGFSGQQEATDFSHVQIIVAEILTDEAVGGEGHVWESPFYSKDIDYSTTLENIIPFCEGQELTKFNVSYHFVQENSEGSFDFVRAYIVGNATTVSTFDVLGKALPLVHVNLDNENKVYCLDPVILTINRHETPDIQNVRIEIGNYIADFEFFQGHNLLEIDLAEYLQTLFALVDLFEFQQMQTIVVVKLYNSNWEHLQTQGVPVTVVHGKKPDLIISDNEIRVQWLDKYGLLHDECFKIAENQTEGASKQKYVTDGEEREDKTGEKSITLAYVLANNQQREALKTVVFADHVRVYIGDSWKRVKVANTYKTGKGREKQNFEFTIKYAI